MKNIKILLAVLSSAALVFVGGCGENKGSTGNNIVYYDSSNSYSQSAEGVENSRGEIVREEEKPENIPTIPANIGENAELAGMDVKITNVYDAGIIEAGDTANYDKQVVAVVCEITNNTDTEQLVNVFDFKVKLIDGEYTDIMTDLSALTQAQKKISSMESLNVTLQPGETVTGYAPFAVYSRWETLSVYYKPAQTDSEEVLAFEISKDMVEATPHN